MFFSNLILKQICYPLAMLSMANTLNTVWNAVCTFCTFSLVQASFLHCCYLKLHFFHFLPFLLEQQPKLMCSEYLFLLQIFFFVLRSTCVLNLGPPASLGSKNKDFTIFYAKNNDTLLFDQIVSKKLLLWMLLEITSE